MTITEDNEALPETEQLQEQDEQSQLTHELEHDVRDDIVLDPKQQEAVDLCCDLTQRVVGVTGAAGSGKTTILRKVYQSLKDHGYNVVLCSPTGKAAKRIYEVTGIPALTIHRLLEYTNPGDINERTGKPEGYSYPRRTRSNPLECDIVLADEFAMVNKEVARALFNALPNGGSIRVFGDNNQLQPIEETDKNNTAPAGPSPFIALLQKFKSVTLETIHRQGQDSGILHNLQMVLRGRMPANNDQWTNKFTDRPVDALRELILDGIEQDIDFSSIDNQVITTQHKSWIGTGKLNAMMQGLFHDRLDPSFFIPRNRWVEGEGGVKGGDIRLYIGDKVIITRNQYDLGVFNGETGKVIEFSSDGEVIIDLGDREVLIPPVMLVVNQYGKTVEIDPRKDIDLAYCVTTHKMQGSEVKRVVYMLNKSTSYMQNRRNFYTAASRAREHVTIITDQRSMGLSLSKMGN